MKIKVWAKGDEGERDISFCLRLPLGILKMDFVWKKLSEKNQSMPIPISGKEIYLILKNWVKENGHLTLVEVDTKDAKVNIVI